MIKLSIVEDNSLIRIMLENFIELQNDIELLSSHRSIESFLDSGESMVIKPEIIIIDIEISDINNMQGLHLISKKHPKIEVLIYSNQLAEDLILEALTNGAFYYSSKLDSMQKLLEQVRMIHAGRTQIQTLWARELLPIIRKKTNYFTIKEEKLINAISEGSSYAKIAGDFECSVAYIETESKNVLSRLHGLREKATYI